MKSTPIISEKRAAIFIWIGTALFTIGAMLFGHWDASTGSAMDTRRRWTPEGTCRAGCIDSPSCSGFEATAICGAWTRQQARLPLSNDARCTKEKGQYVRQRSAKLSRASDPRGHRLESGAVTHSKKPPSWS